MTKKFIATKKLTAIAMAVATMCGGMAVSGTAFAAADTNKANDIAISAQSRKDGDVDRTVNVNGRKFTAYKLGSYENVRFETVGGDSGYQRVKGYDLTSTDNAKISDALKPVVTESAGGKTTVKAKWAEVVQLNDGGDLEFIGNSANLSPIEFVAKHFYGQADDVYGNDHADNAEMRQFANGLRTAGFAAAATTTGADGEARFDLSDDEAGLYLITEDADSANHDADHSGETVSRAMVVGTAFKNGDVYVNKVASTRAGMGGDSATATDVTVGELKIKADKVVIVKDVEGDDALVGFGSVRNFRIDTNVPNYKTDYQDWDGKKPVFTIKDNPSDNLDVTKGATNVISGIKVQANTGEGGAFVDVDESKYTVSLLSDTADDANDFAVQLNDPLEFSGKQIRVTYSAEVASVTLDKTSNVASVDYSNDPYTESHVDTIHNPEEKLYQADLDLTKVNFKKNDEVLNGAEFKVYRDGSENPVMWKASESNFYEVRNGGEGSVDHVTFGNNVQLKGLAADSDSSDADGVTYRFVETKAPEGFLLGKNATPVEFTVTLTPQWANGSSSDTGKSLTGVHYVVNAGKFTKFLDAKGNISMEAAKPTAGVLRTADGTVYKAAEKVENTDDLGDLPKTGAELLSYLALTVAAAVLGGGLMVAARKRQSTR